MDLIKVPEMMSVQGNPYFQIQYQFYHCCASRPALKYIKIHKNKLNTTNKTIFMDLIHMKTHDLLLLTVLKNTI
jgi:hypothetical protein